MSTVFIVIMSTELFCETLVAGGATVTLTFRFTPNPSYLVQFGAREGTLAKALGVWLALRGFSMCAVALAAAVGWMSLIIVMTLLEGAQ